MVAVLASRTLGSGSSTMRMTALRMRTHNDTRTDIGAQNFLDAGAKDCCQLTSRCTPSLCAAMLLHSRARDCRDVKQWKQYRKAVLYLARVASVATSSCGLLLAKQRQIHAITANRACTAFFASRPEATSSATCGKGRYHQLTNIHDSPSS